MQDDYREVRFDIYCETCKHKEKKENEEPCDECLEDPINLNTEKPVRWKEKT